MKKIRANKKALFLDRDGVINKDYGHVYQINKFELIENIQILIKKNTLIKKELLNKKGKLYFNKHNFVKINKVSRKQINFSQNMG